MNRIDRYLVRNFILGIVPVLFLLLALFSLLALTSELEDVGRGNFGQFDAFFVVLLTIPKRMVDLLPVSTLLGGLLGLGAMANHQELIAARIAGMSRRRLAQPVLILAVFLIAMTVLIQSILIPHAERQASELRAKALVQTDMGDGGQFEFWARTDNQFVRVQEVLFNRLLSGVEIYKTDQHGRLVGLTKARRARISGNRNWLLEDISVMDINGDQSRERHVDSMQWPSLLSDEQTEVLMLPIDALSPQDLWRYIDYLYENQLDTHLYEVVFWQQISALIALAGMAMLSLPLLMGSTRMMPASQRVVIGGVIGISFYLLQQLTGHVAALFTLNPPLTILMPAVLLLGVSIVAQFRNQTG